MKTEEKISVIIAEDHKLFGSGMEQLLELSGKFAVKHKFDSGVQLLDRYPELQTDIVVSDINMPLLSGLDMALKIREINPQQKIVFVSMYFDETISNFCRKNNINGFLLKDSTAEDLISGLLQVQKGELIFPAENAVNQEVPLSAKQEQFLMKLKLSHREIEIIQHIKSGKPSRDIAAKLFLSEYTVETHRKNIFRKLNVKSVAALIDFANRNGL